MAGDQCELSQDDLSVLFEKSFWAWCCPSSLVKTLNNRFQLMEMRTANNTLHIGPDIITLGLQLEKVGKFSAYTQTSSFLFAFPSTTDEALLQTNQTPGSTNFIQLWIEHPRFKLLYSSFTIRFIKNQKCIKLILGSLPTRIHTGISVCSACFGYVTRCDVSRQRRPLQRSRDMLHLVWKKNNSW